MFSRRWQGYCASQPTNYLNQQMKSILRFALSYRPLSVQTFLLLSYFFWWCWLLAPRGNWLARSLYPCFVKFVDIIHDTNNCFRKYTDYFVKNQRFHGKRVAREPKKWIHTTRSCLSNIVNQILKSRIFRTSLRNIFLRD